ncbi:DUF4236 domain-containing protein [Streptomyces sp. DH37]|jgi:hypothetical protein|uniref:DUF4236 domain-containing protein n=1 Tax=Streptomyces sp. DH37 TaxID=3040122 RepID=UPI00244113A9|nr:DUF4236 domain-containing protein [Streptomyces sp. DH37]MDG9705710.1 DUF4236 domain-containing protein [Streptomyces sp. DH37]
MPLHYHRHITVVPGLVRLTVGRHGWSVSLGPRRAHITLGRGYRGVTVRLPGGLTWHRRGRGR